MSTRVDERSGAGFEDLRRLLEDKLLHVERRLRERHRHAAYRELTRADLRAFSLLDGPASTISEVAAALGVTRQAGHKAVRKLMALGLVHVAPAPGSDRDKHVHYTAHGHRLARASSQAVREVEAEVAAAIGGTELGALKSLLAREWK